MILDNNYKSGRQTLCRFHDYRSLNFHHNQSGDVRLGDRPSYIRLIINNMKLYKKKIFIVL